MFKNESIEIKPLMNGFEVSYDYRQAKPGANDEFSYNYVSEEYMFKTWDEVVEFVRSKPLEVPPTKL